jgi:phytoene dehydrogenase-like protein
MKSDVVVIGGGISGLAAGALLAKQGKRVTVLEKGNQPGGRAYTYEEKGFTLNYGPHAMFRPNSGFLAELMARLGRTSPPCGFPDPIHSFWADGDRFGPVGAKPHQVLTTPLFPVASRLAFARLFMKLRSVKPAQISDETWGEWVDRNTSDERVRRFARALGTVNTYARPAADLSARFMLEAIQRNVFAKDYVGYMHGGWRSMYDIFIDELRAGGGTLVTGASVRSLDVRDGRVVAAVTDDAHYEADVFVSTLAPQDAPAIAPAGSPLAAELARWSGLEDIRAFCMDLGFSRALRDDLTFVFDINRDLYYSVHSASAPDLAPAGSQLIHAMAYLSPEEADDETLRIARKEELVAGLDLHFARWRDALVVERTLPNVRVGAARPTPGQIDKRVPLRAASASNLYFAGDGRDLPYHLSENCLVSAMQVADAIVSAAAPVSERAAVA